MTPNPRRGSAEFKAWENMIQRCYNTAHKSYSVYGGLGVVVCDRWRKDFTAFFADVGPRPSSQHSLDRFPNNAGNYEPGNVRWATTEEQNRNQRDTKLTDEKVAQIRALRGVQSQYQTAQEFGVSQPYVSRIQRGERWVISNTTTNDIQAAMHSPCDVLRGEAANSAKLTTADVIAIRKIKASTTKRFWGVNALAAHYNVDSSTIRRIVAGDSWRHVAEEDSA